jgi:hypothetical protein
LIELVDLVVEVADAAGEAAQRELCGLRGFVQSFASGAEREAEGGPRLQRAAASELVAAVEVQ